MSRNYNHVQPQSPPPLYVTRQASTVIYSDWMSDSDGVLIEQAPAAAR